MDKKTKSLVSIDVDLDWVKETLLKLMEERLDKDSLYSIALKAATEGIQRGFVEICNDLVVEHRRKVLDQRAVDAVVIYDAYGIKAAQVSETEFAAYVREKAGGNIIHTAHGINQELRDGLVARFGRNDKKEVDVREALKCDEGLWLDHNDVRYMIYDGASQVSIDTLKSLNEEYNFMPCRVSTNLVSHKNKLRLSKIVGKERENSSDEFFIYDFDDYHKSYLFFHVLNYK